jgi:hypothetical protein
LRKFTKDIVERYLKLKYRYWLSLYIKSELRHLRVSLVDSDKVI